MSAIDFTNLAITLAFLAGPLGVAAWAIYWGNLYKNLRTGDSEKFSPIGKRVAKVLQARSPEATQIIHLTGYVAVPTLAKIALSIVPPTTLDFLQPHYSFITLLILSYIGGQFWYAATKEEPAPTASAKSEVSPQGGQSLTLEIGAAGPTPAVVDIVDYGTGYTDPKG